MSLESRLVRFCEVSWVLGFRDQAPGYGVAWVEGVGGPGYRANVQGLGLRDDDLQLVNAAESRF